MDKAKKFWKDYNSRIRKWKFGWDKFDERLQFFGKIRPANN